MTKMLCVFWCFVNFSVVQLKFKRKTSGYTTWFTAWGAIRIAHYDIYVKKLSSLKHCVRSQVTRLKLQKSFCDLEHGASL